MTAPSAFSQPSFKFAGPEKNEELSRLWGRGRKEFLNYL